MMTQKGDPYIKMLNTSSDVILMSCILSQLNILCNNLIKPYFTEMTIHPLFTVQMLRQLHAFSKFQRIGFGQSGVIHISKRSVLYLE